MRTPAGRRSIGLPWLVAAFAVAWALLLAPSGAAAQDNGGTYYRVSYSPYFASQLEKSPADPQGAQSSEPLEFSDKLAVELILWRHVGLSGSRIRMARVFEQNGLRTSESAEGQTVDLTLYASPVSHYSWNFFVGTGYGNIGKYRIKENTVRVDQSPLHRDLVLQRNFAGIEYTWERLGVRYEFNQVRAENSSKGETVELEAMIQYLTLFIPLN